MQLIEAPLKQQSKQQGTRLYRLGYDLTGGGDSGEDEHVKLFAVKVDTGDLREIEPDNPVPFANGAAAYKDGIALLAQVGVLTSLCFEI